MRKIPKDMMILFGEEWEYLWYIFEFVVFKVYYDYDAMIWPFYGSMNMVPGLMTPEFQDFTL